MSGRRNNDNRGIRPNGSRQVETTVAMSRSFSGPLPPPETLAQYNLTLPGAAERILAMAEKQQEHRQDLEKTTVYSNAGAQKQGLYLGFVIALVTIGGGIWLISTGKEATGLAAVITPLCGLVGTFIYGKYIQKKELSDKSAAMVRTNEKF